MKPSPLQIDALQDAVRRMPDNALAASREAALQSVREHGLPTLRHEDWRYTNLESAIDISNRWLMAGAENSSGERLAASIKEITESIDANWLVIANGAVDESYFSSSKVIHVERFSETEAPTKVDRPLADLNAALLQDGLRLIIHAATEEPVGILVIDDAAGGASVSQTSVEIDVMAGCETEIIEYQFSEGRGDHYANSLLTLRVGESARTSYVRIQDRRIGHVQTGRLSVTMGRDSHLNMASYDIGGGLIRNDVDIDLSAPGSDTNFNGLYLAGDGQHIDNHTRVDHRVGPATSSQEYRGILNGNSRCVWNGKAVVHNGADGTDASQENHNLLLSDQAEIDAKPELEIYAEDVKCSHGTTVGQLDESALYYLRTRGLDKRYAKQLLTHAFAADLVHRAPIKACLEVVSTLVEERLATLITEETS